MKLCMNLNLLAEKQNYYQISLNYVVTIVISVSCIKQKNYFFKKKKNSYFLRLLFALTYFTVKLPKMRNYLLESEIGLHCFKKRAFDKLSGEQKRRVKTFFDGKRI